MQRLGVASKPRFERVRRDAELDLGDPAAQRAVERRIVQVEIEIHIIV